MTANSMRANPNANELNDSEFNASEFNANENLWRSDKVEQDDYAVNRLVRTSLAGNRRRPVHDGCRNPCGRMLLECCIQRGDAQTD